MTVTLSSLGSTPTTILGVPTGLTLRNTYTSSTSGLTFPVSQVYVVCVGGGGGSPTGANGSGNQAGGGGACVQGWIPAPTNITIGAGGTNAGTAGGQTILTNASGTLLVAGGGGGPGAGGGSIANTANVSSFAMNAVSFGGGMGGSVTSGIAGIFLPSIWLTAIGATPYQQGTSGAGGYSQATANGIYVGGGGNGTTINGGSGVYAGGTSGANASGTGGGGGGGGLLGAGSNGTAASGAVGGNAGAGGNGGGGAGSSGAGNGATGGTGAAGGNGCVLVYY